MISEYRFLINTENSIDTIDVDCTTNYRNANRFDTLDTKRKCMLVYYNYESITNFVENKPL